MKDVREFFDGLGLPSPPSDLRSQVLSAASKTLAREPRGPWTRVWESQSLRISWAATIALLSLSHLALSLKIPRHAASPFSTSVRHPGESDLARTTVLPRIDSSAGAWTALEDEELIDRFDRFHVPVRSRSRKEKSS